MKNGVRTIIENNGFTESKDFASVDAIKVKYTYQKDNMKFTAIEFTYSSDRVNYVLSKSHTKFGFVSETYIVWESYKQCLKELQEALNWMYEKGIS